MALSSQHFACLYNCHYLLVRSTGHLFTLLSLFLCVKIEITLRLILYAIMWLGRFVHVNKNANVKRVILVTLCFKIFMILLMDDDWFLKLCANLYVDPIAS